MFTRAGFNPRHRVVCFARVRIGNAFGWGQLMRWVPSGDLGWYIPGRALAWRVDYLFDRLHGAGTDVTAGPRSRLPT